MQAGFAIGLVTAKQSRQFNTEHCFRPDVPFNHSQIFEENDSMSKATTRNSTSYARCSLAAAFIFAVVVTAAGQAHAFPNPVKQLKDAAKRAENSVRREAGNASNSFKRAHRLNYVVKIVNPKNSGSGYLFYNFNGETQIGLRKGVVRTHRGTIAGSPYITFKNGRGQTIRYRLQSGKTYEFRWNRGVLNLVRR